MRIGNWFDRLPDWASMGLIIGGIVAFVVTFSLAMIAFTDMDDDGYSMWHDCKDGDENSYPGAEEIHDDRDNDCDGWVDEDFPTSGTGEEKRKKSTSRMAMPRAR